MSSWFTCAKTWIASKVIYLFVAHEGLESQPKVDDNGEGFFGLNALDIDGNKVDFKKDLKDKNNAYLIVNVATE